MCVSHIFSYFYQRIFTTDTMRLNFFSLNELNFVEFNITGDNDTYSPLQEESAYLGSEVFNLFLSCFENSNELYEYFEPTRFNSRKIVVLRNELISFLDKLNAIDGHETLETFIDSLFLGKEFFKKLEADSALWKDNWASYLEQLKDVNKKMIAIVERCIDEGRILWLVGY
jgi:hypothetical protein